MIEHKTREFYEHWHSPALATEQVKSETKLVPNGTAMPWKCTHECKTLEEHRKIMNVFDDDREEAKSNLNNANRDERKPISNPGMLHWRA